MCWTYIVQCADGSLYTGWTTDLNKRIRVHNAGTGAKYTKARRPVKLVWSQEHTDKQSAMKQEYAIKQLSRQEKLDLIQSRDISKQAS
jgi:putative endonuclease